MSRFDIRKWNKLNESTERPQRMTTEEKKQTLEAVAKFNEYTQHVYKTNELKEMIENIRTLSENASKMAIEETADWFDVVSVKRDTKAIGESVKLFESTTKEIATLQQRLESVFEDIGSKLGKYYEIHDISEAMDAVGKEDGDIDNDGDEDKSDEYLAKKRAAITKAIKNEDSDYQEKFKDALEDEGVNSPAELDDEEKKAFFNKMDKSHKAKNESTRRLAKMLEGTINEGFATWKMQFAAMTLGGVELDPKKVYTVKARSTVEAIKKASKMAGLQDKHWMSTQTHKLTKVG